MTTKGGGVRPLLVRRGAGSVSYPFVADSDNFPRKHPVRAIVIHMAQGGGTVGYLQRTAGNSCHYVVERTGRVVQMVREDRASGSINPRDVRTTDDKPYDFLGETITYGVTANKAALGDAWNNPNSAVIAIEVEGFAVDGPSPVQRAALRALVFDIRTRHDVVALGHRDFQDYKACPGKLIPWADYGGHGTKEEPDVPGLRVHTTGDFTGRIRINDAGASAVQLADREMKSLPLGYETAAYATAELAEVFTTPGGTEFPVGTVGYLVGLETAFVFGHNADPLPAPPPDTSGDVNAAVDYITEGYVELGLRIEEARAR